MSGTIGISALGGGKSVSQIEGEIIINTSLCPSFPVGGSITIETEIGRITIIFDGNCDGGYEVGTTASDPGPDFDLIAVGWHTEDSPLGAINSTNSEWVDIGSAGMGRLNALARAPSGALYSFTNEGTCEQEWLVQMPSSGGAATTVGALSGLPVEVFIAGLAFSPGGTLYAVIGHCHGEYRLFATIDPSTAAATQIAELPEHISGIDFDPVSGVLYGWSLDSGLVTIDPATGALSDVNPAQGGDVLQALVALPDGSLLAARNTLFSINKATGEVTELPGSLPDVRGLELRD